MSPTKEAFLLGSQLRQLGGIDLKDRGKLGDGIPARVLRTALDSR
ncbi:MAG TPA: hypothetical protein VFU04_05975 [Solirubrobacterales bacterium]|nr:hypothetical protein [Solirubrobacterales bacterium]